MSNYITPAEVITLAFNRTIESDKILDTDITAAEWRFIKPILTTDLFNDTKDNPTRYDTLIDDYI